MSETSDENKPPSPTKPTRDISSDSLMTESLRRIKPQTLASIEATQKLNDTKLTQQQQNESSKDIRSKSSDFRMKSATTASVVESKTKTTMGTTTTHMARNRARTRAYGDEREEREHSCDGVTMTRMQRHLTTPPTTKTSNLTGSDESGSTMTMTALDATAAAIATDIDNIASNRRSSAGSSSTTTADEFSGINTSAITPRRESLNYDDTSPSGQSIAKSSFGRSLRHPAGGAVGATTRKCVLTLDGYSYVIVASTPENLSKRDEPTGIGNNSGIGSGIGGTAISGATTSSGGYQVTSAETTLSEHSKANSPTGGSSNTGGVIFSGNSGANASGNSSACSASLSATEANICGETNTAAAAALNGQVARHGSLTIVRRSNSRKNFTQIADTQQQSSAATTPLLATSPAGAGFASQLQQNITNTTTTSSSLTSPQLFLKTQVPDEFACDLSSSNSASINATPTITNTQTSANTFAATNPFENCSKVLTTTTASEAIKSAKTTITTDNKNTFTAIQQQQQKLATAGPSPTGSYGSSSTVASAFTTTTSGAFNAATATAAAMQPTSPNATNFRPTSEREHESPEGSNDSLTDPSSVPVLEISLATENLPAVDTPDACDKAALRLRHLLRLLNNGEVSAEVLRKNLHYAARVLEAVFLDESKDPHVGRKSSVDDEDCHFKEDHGAAIFGVSFNHKLGADQPLIFATAGSNRCTVYECPRDGGIQLQLCYADPDPDEVFYTCAWSFDIKKFKPLLAVAGYRGVIRVIDVQKNESICNYIGHGQAINELKFHPRQPHLLLSGSKDHAMRLWNTQSHVCIAIFGGVEGHRDEVLSIDFDVRGERIMSSGMDHSLKLWNINTPEFQEKIEFSANFNPNKSQRPFPTVMQHFPNFSTRDIHRNYVDCVQCFGDFILSKSCENSIVCWKMGQFAQSAAQMRPNDSSTSKITEFSYDECELWFVRFGFNPYRKVLALGNQLGKVYVWELDTNDPQQTHASYLYNNRCNSTVRQVAFSRDASVLVYVCDDGTVWRWNKKSTSP